MSEGANRPDRNAASTPVAASLAHDPLVLEAPGAHLRRRHPSAGSWVVRIRRLDGAMLSATGAVLERLGGRLHVEASAAPADTITIAQVPASAVAGLAAAATAASGAAAAPLQAINFAIAAHERQRFTLRCGDHQLLVGPRPLIMGIINCTPDSFWAGSTAAGDAAIARGEEMVAAGADLLDVGGESTRPDSQPVPAGVELERVLPVIRQLARRVAVPISIDTTKSTVAEAAVEAGATIVNDISGLLYDPRLAAVAARHDLPLVVMHMRGRPSDMYERALYDDVVAEVASELRDAVRRANEAGVEQVIVDPGIGFAKRPDASLALLHRLPVLRSLGCPILVGPSRKSFIGAVLDLPVQERLEGTAAAVAAAVLGGAHILRVHDVEAMRRVATVAAAIRDEGAACSP